MKEPASVIASHLMKHAQSLRKVQRKIELFMPLLQDAIDKTQRMATAFEKSVEAKKPPTLPKGELPCPRLPKSE